MKLMNVKKVYHNQSNDVVALKGINLEIDHCGITMILGASGCGKTTLLNIIAGRESYEGQVKDVSNFDYLTQDFQLFESMSVLDNLLLVSKDEKKIDQYLKEFSLFNKKYDKVKKCSNGEKKRVQFIRALLHQPGLLLCDEPTAALDHDNTVLLMKELQKISQEIQIIMVTHDIALAEEYADRIIVLDQGEITKDETFAQKQPAQKGNQVEKKSLKDTFKVCLKEIKSSLGDSVLNIVLLSLSILTLFTIFNLNANISSQSDYLKTFKEGQNMIVSVGGYNEEENPHEFSQSDFFAFDQIQSLIQQTPEIMAVEAWRSGDAFSAYCTQVEDSQAFEMFAKRHSSFDGGDFMLINIPRSQVFILPKDYTELSMKEFRQDVISGKLMSPDEVGVSCFDLVNDYQDLPLLCGTLPKENEVLLSKDSAELLMRIDGYENFEDLVGKEMAFGVRDTIGGYLEEDDIDPKDCKRHIDNEANKITAVISGVTQIHNKYTRMVFFGGGFGKDPIYQACMKDVNHFQADILHIILQPGSDYDAIADKINQYFSNPKNEMTRFNGKGLTYELEFYESPTGFMSYALTIFGILFVILVLQMVFKKKKMMKEKMILKTYGYSITLENIVKNFFLTLFAGILSLLLAQTVTIQMNTYARLNHYQEFMNMDMGLLLGIIFGMWILMVVLEMILFPKRKM